MLWRTRSRSWTPACLRARVERRRASDKRQREKKRWRKEREQQQRQQRQQQQQRVRILRRRDQRGHGRWAMQVQVAAHSRFLRWSKEGWREEQEGQEDDKTLQQHREQHHLQLGSFEIAVLCCGKVWRCGRHQVPPYCELCGGRFALRRGHGPRCRGRALPSRSQAADADTKAQLMKFYKIQEKELQASTLVEAVVARQAVRDC